MSANQSRKGDAAAKQSDLMLWIAAGAIAAVGTAWLVISKPWSDGPQRTVNAAASAPAPASREPVELALAVPAAPDGTLSGISATLDNPLRMAQLAFDAGMLVEPEDYSAWTLYSQVLDSEPDSAAAREGLTKVADELVRRGTTALEQGRFDDVRRTTERVLAVLPQHAAAKDLAAKLWPAAVAGPVETEALKPELDVRQAPPPVESVEPVRAAPAPAPARDLVAEANTAFQDAMSQSLLLAPAGQSARHFLDELIALAPNHETTELASRRLSDELLSRSQQSIEALDIEAARVWIDEAERIGIDPRGVRAARDDLTNQLIALESAKPVPASALQIANYVVPEYPSRALDRGLEGWVDVEFTLGTDGTTRDVTVADASHEVFFRREAVEAVEAWTFQPRVFMNRTIEQRTYTRIRFVQ